MNTPSAATASPALKDAWQEYQAAVEDMRLAIEATPRFQDTPQHRAKGYHTLMEMQAMAYNFAVAPRMEHPRIYVNCGWQTDMYTLGQNGQDFLYGVAFLDGRQTYRLTGRLGDITLFLLQTLNGLFGEKDVKAVGNYDWADFKIGADGRFAVTLSASEQSGNWIKLDGSVRYQFLLIRRALPNWEGDPGELRLERISEIPADYYVADEFDESALAGRIRRAGLFVRYLTQDFSINLYDMYLNNAGRQKNKLTLLPGTVTSQVGSPSSNYAMAIFELQPDEALIIELDKRPDGAYWSFQLGDVWSRALDFSNRQTSLNDHEVSVDEDGAMRIVVSHQDPGITNWLDPCGRVEGTIVFRNYRARTGPVPASRKVKFAEVNGLLPKETSRVSAAKRKQDMERRRRAQRRLYGE
ncbi:MAG TPA: DUF1214 domain-containing protein [Steroidobacteraceae bacterium]|nr:DUF1214 domain-containing protein [Steroidobacteraceae bacterium]